MDEAGSLDWSWVIGGVGADIGHSIVDTYDGGFVLTGRTMHESQWDVLVAKLNATGAVEWTQVLGGIGTDAGYSIQQTHDGDFVLGGYTTSFGAGKADVLITRLNQTGGLKWASVFGGLDNDAAYAIEEINNSSLVLAGQTYSYGQGGADALVLKLNATGAVEWAQTMGGQGFDRGYSIQAIGEDLLGLKGVMTTGNETVASFAWELASNMEVDYCNASSIDARLAMLTDVATTPISLSPIGHSWALKASPAPLNASNITESVLTFMANASECITQVVATTMGSARALAEAVTKAPKSKLKMGGQMRASKALKPSEVLVAREPGVVTEAPVHEVLSAVPSV